jgi:hypothetical protein
MLFVLSEFERIRDIRTLSDEPYADTPTRDPEYGSSLIDIYPYKMEKGERSENTTRPDDRKTKSTQMHEKGIKITKEGLYYKV